MQVPICFSLVFCTTYHAHGYLETSIFYGT